MKITPDDSIVSRILSAFERDCASAVNRLTESQLYSLACVARKEIMIWGFECAAEAYEDVQGQKILLDMVDELRADDVTAAHNAPASDSTNS